MLSVKQGGIKYHFFEFVVWLDLGLNPSLPGHWRTLDPFDYIYIYIYISFLTQYKKEVPKEISEEDNWIAKGTNGIVVNMMDWDIVVRVMDCGIVVSEFVLQSRYYIHFRANTLEKGMNPLILPAMG